MFPAKLLPARLVEKSIERKEIERVAFEKVQKWQGGGGLRDTDWEEAITSHLIKLRRVILIFYHLYYNYGIGVFTYFKLLYRLVEESLLIL